jgi:hypothetical protein
MTSFAFILGVLPLAFSSGAGAVARQTMGTAVMGGTTAASLIAIFFIPVTFYAIGRLSDRREQEGLEEMEAMSGQMAPSPSPGNPRNPRRE